MGQTRASRTSLNAGTPDSLSDNESSFRTQARKTSSSYRSTLTPGTYFMLYGYLWVITVTCFFPSFPSTLSVSMILNFAGGSRPSSRPASRPASRPGSRPASRQGSKPSSRYGSTLSLDSTGEPRRVSSIYSHLSSCSVINL